MGSRLRKVVIVGTGGAARETLDIFNALNDNGCSYDVTGFVVDSQYGSPGTFICDKPILGGFDWLAKHKEEVDAICGVGAPEIRMQLVERIREIGARFCHIVHPKTVLARGITIGEGSTIAAGCVFMNQTCVGNHVRINAGCTIGHDVVLEDFVTVAPGVHISGNVTLKKGCYIGTGANIIEKKLIGAWSTVGAGATVIRDVPMNATVVGVPGKVIKTKPVGWNLG